MQPGYPHYQQPVYYPQPYQPKIVVHRSLEYPDYEDLEDYYPHAPNTDTLLKRFLGFSYIFPGINILLALVYFLIIFYIAPASDTSGFNSYLSAIEQLTLILILGPISGIISSIAAMKLSTIDHSRNYQLFALISLILNIATPIIVFLLLQFFL